MGDFDIDINTAGMDVYKLNEFCNVFDLTNLIKTEKCCTENHKSTIDLFLTNGSLSFQKTRTTETWISDYHKLISTFFKSHYTRLKLRIIYYRNYKNCNEDLFLKDLENSNLSANSDDPHENYSNLSQTFSKVVQKHARLKKNYKSHCGGSALNHTVKILLRKVLSQISHSGISLNLFWPTKAAIHKMM